MNFTQEALDLGVSFYLFAPTWILRDIDVKMRMREAAVALRRVDVRVPRPLALAACRACLQLGTGVCTWYLARVRTYSDSFMPAVMVGWALPTSMGLIGIRI